MLDISATRVQDLEVLGPTAVSYISKEQGLHLGQGQEQRPKGGPRNSHARPRDEDRTQPLLGGGDT